MKDKYENADNENTSQSEQWYNHQASKEIE